MLLSCQSESVNFFIKNRSKRMCLFYCDAIDPSIPPRRSLFVAVFIISPYSSAGFNIINLKTLLRLIVYENILIFHR